MTIGNDNAASAPLFIEIRPGMRKALADAVEAFLNLLDQIDADADLEEDDAPEDDGSGESALGSTSAINQERAWRASAGWPEDGEAEPSLGWSGNGRGHPEIAMRGYDDDREGEHDGREPDVDDEPSLGSGARRDQTCWAVGGDDDRELDEAERSGCGDMDGVMEQYGFGVQFAE